MQSIPTALSAHFGQEVTTLATCWTIARKDGITLYFTDHDGDLSIEGERYLTASGMSASAVSSQAGLTVDNVEFDGIFSADAITENDILAGRYDHAQIGIFLVNYGDTTMGRLLLKSGWLGEVTLRGGAFVAEMRGLSSSLQQTIGDVYTNTCRAQFGDARCKKDLSAFTVTGTVTGSEASYGFTDSTRGEISGYFAYGVITFITGENAGLSMEVRDYNAGRFGLFLPLPYAIAVGDAYRAVAGCDKSFAACVGRFANALNFRGEPHVPGTDKLLETSATRSG